MAKKVRDKVAAKGDNELIGKSFIRNLAKLKNPRTFVTCPIYYASGQPHIGHLHTTVLGDFYHRWFQLNHYNSQLSTGTDEHGTKIVRKFNENKQNYYTIDDFVAAMSSNYQREFETINITTDRIRGGHFIRTTDEKHKHVAQEMWAKMSDKISIEQYSGWYSFNDETFVPETKQTIDENGKRFATDSMHELEFVEESNYFFDFSQYLDKIELYIRTAVCTSNRASLLSDIAAYREKPDTAKLCISRPNERMRISPESDVTWGVPVPDGSHQMYVWFEALCSYVTAASETNQASNWPPTLQIIGRDIATFHCIYLPAMLLATGMELPRAVLIHGHWTNLGEKMSKSKENYVTLDEMAKVVNGQTDAIRWFLLNNVSELNKNYSDELLRIQTDQSLGRHLASVVEMVTSDEINPYQTYPPLHNEMPLESVPGAIELMETVRKLPAEYAQHINNGHVSQALRTLTSCSKAIVTFTKSHNLDQIDRANLEQRLFSNAVLHLVYESLRVTAILLQPATPTIATKVLNRLGVALESRHVDDAADVFAGYERAGRNLGPGQGHLFVTQKQLAKEASFLAHLKERQHIREQQQLNTRTIYQTDNMEKQKDQRRKKKYARLKAKRKADRKAAARDGARRSGMEGLEEWDF